MLPPAKKTKILTLKTAFQSSDGIKNKMPSDLSLILLVVIMQEKVLNLLVLLTT
jgi:hypothetical protein